MFSDEDPHRRHNSKYGSISYWKEGAASSQSMADAASLVVGNYPEFSFKLPEEKFKLEMLERALINAFEYGRAAAKKEIRNALGVKEVR